MINNVCLVGRLTRPVDLRYTQNGTAFGSFSLAIDRNYKKESGEKEMKCTLSSRQENN